MQKINSLRCTRGSNLRSSILRALWLTAAISTAAWAQQYTISTVAGNGTSGYSGDGGAAKSAMLNGPIGVAVDASSNLDIADAANQVVRRVTAGKISTLAGTGTAGYAGDGSGATGAELNTPTRAVTDTFGNVYIADSGNNVIRMIAPSGVISTVAGNVCVSGQTTPCGAGPYGDGGPATSAQLNNPLGIAVDSAGNLYIADTGNGVIREVSGGIIKSIGFSLELKNPVDVAVDSADNLYIADQSNSRIVKVTPKAAATIFAGNGTIGFSGDGGPATKAELSLPTGVAVDGVGNLYIADTGNQRIRMVGTNGVITTIAGAGASNYTGDGGPATSATLFDPRGVAVDAWGTVYVGDTGNNVVRALQAPNPALTANGVVNGASFATGMISPGALASIFGTNFLATTASATAFPLPTNLSGVQVSVNGQLAPILYAGPTQVNFQVPWETQTGSATIVLSRNGISSNAPGTVSSNAVTVPVLAAAPGLFLEASGAAVVQNQDYSLNQPSNPAAAGSTVTAYFTGTGPISGSVQDGAATPIPPPYFQSTSTYSAMIGTTPATSATVSFAGLTPGFAGLAQANIVIPSGIAAGTYPLTITIDGQTSNSGMISVQ